ncbi:MAG: magnesium transporter [Ruminococcaceae bacterium]|nr:magnesium transporter [Oscillospiraceae bacterium]
MEKEQLFEAVTEYLEKGDYQAIRAILSEEEPYDLAVLCEEFDEKQLPIVFRLMAKDLAAECFSNMSSELQELLLKRMSDAELKAILDEMFVDDTVDVIEEMPANVAARMLANSDPETRQQINQILNYPKDSAGSIMTTEYVRLNKNMSVADAFVRIRRVGYEKETIYTCYVTESDRTLVGVVTAMDLMLAETDKLISELMETNVISAKTDDDRESVVKKFSDYDFLALPVVDGSNRLVGIVTVDDAIDVALEEATEDLEIMAGITPSDKPYLKVGVFSTWLSRVPWLMLLMLSATFTGAIISSYEEALKNVVILTAFIPMLMGTAGNAGGQSSVTIIRALSLGDVVPSDILRILWKELRVSILCGVSLAAVGYFKAIWLDGADSTVALVVCLTLLATVVASKIVGCVFPVAIKKLGFDPAVVASPFITTVIDALALVVYFAVATALLDKL